MSSDLRLQQLADNIRKHMELIKNFDDALLLEDDPLRRAKYINDIDRLRNSMKNYQKEYDDLQNQITGSRGSAEQPLAVNDKLEKIKILFLAANPIDMEMLALNEEIREITLKIRSADHRDSIELISAWAVRPDDLLQLLSQHKPHIVHFSGHGSDSEEIILTDSNGASKPVSSNALKALFTTLKDNIRVVVLNACYSRPQAEAITQVIDCAVGMSDSIGDEAAITFAASFYQAIGFGRTIKESFDQGITALLLEGIPEENTPQLLVRSGADPSKIVLVR